MSTTIDERVLEMRFDNRQFENNVSNSMSTLDKLKQKLNLTGAAKGLEDVGSAAKGINLGGLTSAAETVGLKFNAMYTIADQALRNITTRVQHTAESMVKALTIDPIKTGLSEYETQINAVQTILANTESKGTTLGQVNAALDQLNTYADKTIYNFTEMTRNIGTFTAAGVDLKTSVNAIQGIANLAAVSGSSSQQASTAMYQLSQALASGTVKLMDWNSVVNAGMGGQVFQDALKETARLHGVSIDKMIEKNGSFRETLQEGWLTADILTETLSHFTMAAEEGSEQWEKYKKSLMDDGYTADQAEAILKLSNTATEAATKVKTATQLWDTLKETAQSGWTQTWEIILGDFGEAKELFSGIYETLSPMLESMSKARNELLSEGLSSGWKQLMGQGIADEEGYRESIKNVAKDHGIAIDDMIKAEKELDSSLDDTGAFQKVLSKGLADGTINSDMLIESVTHLADKMRNMTDAEREAAGYTEEHIAQIEALEKGLKDGSISMDEFVKKMQRPSGRENLIQALLNSFKGLMSVITPIKEAFSDIFPAMTGEQLYQITERIRDFTEGLTISSDTAEKLKRIFKGVFSIFDIGRKVVSNIAKAFFDLAGSDGISSLGTFLLDTLASLGDFFTSLNAEFDISGLSGMLSQLVSGISNFLGGAVGHLETFGDVFSFVGDTICNVASKIWEGLKTVFTWISDTFSIGDIFAGLAGGGIFLAAKKLSGFLDKIVETIKGMFGGEVGGLKELIGKFGDVLDSVGDSLNAFAMGVKISSLVSIAIAVGILSASLKTISGLDAGNIVKSLVAIGVMMSMLSLTLGSVTKTLSKYDSKGVVKAGISLILIAASIGILADAMKKISEMPLKDIGKSLIGVGGGLVALSVGLKIIGKTKISLSTSIAMLALAESCKILGDALQKFATLSWDEIGRGLTAMGGALGEFVIAMGVLNKFGGINSMFGSAGILIAVQSLQKMADGLKSFAEMTWEEIGRGLAGMGGALGEVSIVVGAVGKIAGFSSIFAAGSIWIVTQGLSDLADALKSFAEMTWEEIGRGLAGMGGALTEVGIVTGGLGAIAGFSGLFASGAILIVIQGLADLAEALKSFAEMTWDEIGRGLAGMGGALAEVGIITGALGRLTGLSGLLGAGSLLLAIQGLGDLADALKKFAEMTWDEITRGLVGMGGALAEVAIITGGLGALAGLPSLLGAGSILLAIQGLGDLADALKKFGEMSWDEIGRGLSAMGAALGEIAIGGFLNTLSIIGSYSISEMAEPLGVLADSVKKWSGVTVPEGLGWQLAGLAAGISSFTFGGLGAMAIAEVAAPLGTLASSVTKWSGVSVPEGLSGQLTALADGVGAFTFGGLGASAIAELATPLGNLATSVSKWSGVTIPENLEAGLQQIANGVGAFSFAFMGGWSIDTIVEPLGALPDAIKKWNGINIPDGLEEDLKSLADAVLAFTWTFVGGWSIDAVTGPLGDLASAVKKWNGVTIPSDIGDKLKSVASGVKAFSGITDISTATNGMKSIASSATKLAGISYTTIGTGMTILTSALTKLSAVKASDFTSLETISESIGSVVDAVKQASSKLVSAGTDMASSIAKGIQAGRPRITSAVTTTMTAIHNTYTQKMTAFVKIGSDLASALARGFSSRKVAVSTAAISALSGALAGIRSKWGGFYSAGSYLVSGFAAGISANSYMAAAKAAAMANAAEQAARKALDINSPSKVFRAIGYSVPEGFAMGIDKFAKLVTVSSTGMANTAIDTVKTSIARIADVVDANIDAQPTIRPVVDLSNVRSGVKNIGTMFNTIPSASVLANIGTVGTLMGRYGQNGGNTDIIDAIDKLRKDLGNVGNTYNYVDGVTYDDGSNIAAAVKTITRVARMERRV